MKLEKAAAWIGTNSLRLLGWKVVGEPPAADRYVLIAAPHTSNWDFPLMLLFAMALGFRPSWVGKDTLFRAPFGALMRFLGGIPVVRSASQNMVEQLAARFASASHLVLAMPPEGTRARAPYWKSGFYHVAVRAGVAIAPSFLDYGKKEGGIGPLFAPAGDLSRDMNALRAFYAGRRGRYPHLQGPVRLRAEDEPAQENPAAKD